MPFYDRICKACAWLAIDVFEPVNVDQAIACPACGATTERAWITKAATVFPDACDFTVTNGTKVPIRFRSRLEHKRWLKEQGFAIDDHHRPLQGTDKSPYTSNWSQVYDPYTAANVKELLERAFHAEPSRPDPADAPFHITWRTGELTESEAADYARRRR